MSKRLPPPFAELEPWVAEWAIEDGHERYVKRVNSSMTQLRQFYDAVFPHATDAVIYLDQFDYHEPLPDDAANLRKLLYSLIRSEERRVGKECDSTCRSRWSP